MKRYEIEPQDATILGSTYVLDVVGLNISYAPFDETMSVPYQLYANTGSYQVMSGIVDLDEATVSNWGTDDNYIIDAACSAIGVTRV